MLKIYLSSSSSIPKCLACFVTIAMFDELKLPSMKKNQKVMVAEVVYLLGAYARNPAGWAVLNQWNVPLEWNGGME